MNNKKDFYFDIKFLKALIRLIPSFFPKGNWYSECTILATLILSLASEWVGYKIGMIPGQMYSALIDSNSMIFWQTIATGSLMYVGKCLLLSLVSFSSWCVYLIFRNNITHSLHNSYFNELTAYKLLFFSHNNIDNTDQRITQDVDKMCKDLSITIIPAVLICPFVIGYYTYKTYTTAGGYGCGMVYGYFIIGTIVNKLLISPIAKWTNRVERCEGNFRYKEVSIRDNIEQISFYGGQNFEKKITNNYLYKLLKTQFNLCTWRFLNTFWMSFFSYYGGLLSYAIQYLPIFVMHSYKDVDPKKLPEIISNNAFIYIYLVNSFTRLTDVALVVGETAGVLQRIYELLKECNEMDEANYYDNIEIIDEDDSVSFKFNDIYINNPRGDILVKNMSLIIDMKINLLINGPSGIGKTSIVRILSGIWKITSGEIIGKYSIDDIEIIPQKPYLPVGNLSLYQILMYPLIDVDENLENDNKSNEIFVLLERLNLVHLIGKIDSIFDELPIQIINTLTPGEVQKLVFIRSIIKDPKIMILDESTNSVDLQSEQIMYSIMKEHNIQYISIGHRDSLKKYHDQCLILDGHGNYTIENL